MSSLTDLRWSLRRAGFAPLPLEGKRPILREWEKRLLVSLEEIMSWERFFPAAVNTGVLTKLNPAIDIDIMHPEAAEAVEALARERFCEHGAFLVRIGKAPKKAILFRGEQPFKKITTNLQAPGGGKHQIEVLADGQQLACFGSHPDTGTAYTWFGGSPGQIPRTELCPLTEIEARAFVQDATNLLRDEFDYKTEVTSGGVTKTTWRDLAAAAVVSEGARNATIARFAGHLLRHFVDPYVALELLLAWNTAHCRPPLDAKEITRTVNSIAGKEFKRRSS
jgi:Bifunctional DNA primase/polymerase, N-terminal/Primase C terminal 1 (PriCT-1)